MHIKISKAALSEALNSVSTVVAAKATLPILQNVKISVGDGTATFICTDLDSTLIARADCTIIEKGETTIPVKTFAAAVSKVVEGDVDLDVNEQNIARLKAGTSKFNFKGTPAAEFPSLSNLEGTPITIPTAVVRDMLRKTSFAMSLDDTRRALNSVLLDIGAQQSTAVATDGRRLSMLNCQMATPEGYKQQFVIPRKAVDILLKKLPKDGECILIASGTQLRFVTPKMELSTKLVDQVYPNYRQVIPTTVNTKVVVDRVELIGALDRVSVFTMVDVPLVILTFENNRLELNSGETEYGASRDEVPIKYDGEKIEMRFNPFYIKDVLNALDEDEVEFNLIDAKSQVVIKKATSDDYTYVCMPLRTN